MKNWINWSLLGWAVCLWSCQSSTTTQQVAETVSEAPAPKISPIDRFEPAIVAYEQGDSVDAPPKGGVVFAGSSSVRMWKTLAEDLAPLPVLNRGFGGSTFPELLHYADRIIFAYEPRCVVLYEGDNDIAADSMQPEDVLANLQVYLEQAEKAIPGSQTYFLAVKPSIRRKELLPKAQRTNALIRQFAAQTEGLFFLDVASVMMESETQIRSDIFIQDSLHMNPTGYALWTEVVRPALMAGCQ